MILLDPLARPVIAHRGASGSFPENTLLAFREAVAAGADALELDVRVTADGRPVVMHDARVDRTTDGTGPLAAMPWSAVRALRSGDTEAVPALSDVLESMPDIPLLVEIKSLEAARPVRDLLLATGAAGRVVVGSFDWRTLRPFRGAGIPVAASRWGVAGWWLASRVIRRAPPGSARALSVPERSGRLRVVDAPLLRAARRAGCPVHVWTVDDPDRAVRLWTAGVSGIITNWPDRMLEARRVFLNRGSR